jgi:SAM-dependent methyltransferase
MAVRLQDYQFVEQSKGVSMHTYDVARITADLRGRNSNGMRIADVGGGIGTVGLALVKELDDVRVDVVDNSELAATQFSAHDRLELIPCDYFEWSTSAKYDAVIFRTVLHHFVGSSTQQTRRLQVDALQKAKELLKDDGLIYVTENFYEPAIGTDLTGELIYQLTKLEFPARVFRTMGANTAGEGGVRFRSDAAWQALFRECGLDVSASARLKWPMPLWQRLPLLCRYRFQALVALKKSGQQ